MYTAHKLLTDVLPLVYNALESEHAAVSRFECDLGQYQLSI